MIDRVKEVLRAKSKSVREFAELIGVKQVTLNQQLNTVITTASSGKCLACLLKFIKIKK